MDNHLLGKSRRHVLKQVDTKVSEKHRMVINDELQKIGVSKPEPRIYWDFITKMRNSFLKKYNYGIRRQFTRSWKKDEVAAAIDRIDAIDKITACRSNACFSQIHSG